MNRKLKYFMAGILWVTGFIITVALLPPAVALYMLISLIVSVVVAARRVRSIVSAIVSLT